MWKSKKEHICTQTITKEMIELLLFNVLRRENETVLWVIIIFSEMQEYLLLANSD